MTNFSSGDETIDNLDLTSVVQQSIESVLGPKWSEDYACQVAELYRSYLWLCKRYPVEQIIPNMDIDWMWHLHILDTKKYARDCETIFGRFLHHCPQSEGSDGARVNLEKGFSRTLELVSRHFPHMVS